MLQSVVANGHSFEECKEVLKNSELSVQHCDGSDADNDPSRVVR